MGTGAILREKGDFGLLLWKHMGLRHLTNVTLDVHIAPDEHQLRPTSICYRTLCHNFYGPVHTPFNRKWSTAKFPTSPSDLHAPVIHHYTKSRFITEHHPIHLCRIRSIGGNFHMANKSMYEERMKI
ncbi:hypothetical protein Trydic_g11518 [Trypoxylus dichotomus]